MGLFWKRGAFRGVLSIVSVSLSWDGHRNRDLARFRLRQSLPVPAGAVAGMHKPVSDFALVQQQDCFAAVVASRLSYNSGAPTKVIRSLYIFARCRLGVGQSGMLTFIRLGLRVDLTEDSAAPPLRAPTICRAKGAAPMWRPPRGNLASPWRELLCC